MIKKLTLMILLVSSMFALEVNWAKDYQSGIAKATKQHKPVLFIVSRDTCKYCVMLDKQTLKDKKVITALNKDFIAIRSWTNKHDYIPSDIARNTPGLPGIWFLASNGEPLFRPILGYVTKEKFLEALAIVHTEFQKQNKGKK